MKSLIDRFPDSVDRILNGAHVLSGVIRYLDTEGILDGHHDLYDIEGVHLEVIHEASLWGDLRRIHTRYLIHDNLLQLLKFHGFSYLFMGSDPINFNFRFCL